MGRTFTIITVRGAGTATFNELSVSAGQAINPPGFLRTGGESNIIVEVSYPDRQIPGAKPVPRDILRPGARGDENPAPPGRVAFGVVRRHAISPNSRVDICNLR